MATMDEEQRVEELAVCRERIHELQESLILLWNRHVGETELVPLITGMQAQLGVLDYVVALLILRFTRDHVSGSF